MCIRVEPTGAREMCKVMNWAEDPGMACRVQQDSLSMYSRHQTTPLDQRSDRPAGIVDHRTETFRPVALPALAAAVQAAARKPARTSRANATHAARFEHEDMPLS